MSTIPLEELSDKINLVFKNNRQLAPYALKARVYDNGTVQIQGIVDVLEEKIQAEELVWNFPGVKKVENNITVCTDGEIDDSDVAFEVGEELLANPEIPKTVGFKVNGGEVQLVGSVTNFNEERRAVETAAKARGVRDVVSRLRLQDQTDDASLNNIVQAALMEEPDLVPGRIKTITANGIVTLYGKIPENQAVLAIDTVSKVPGVKSIRNFMNQQPTEADDQVVIRFMEEMASNPYLNRAPVSIEVADGKVTISGEIDNFKAKKDIEEIIHKILSQFKPQVYNVDNKLRLVEE